MFAVSDFSRRGDLYLAKCASQYLYDFYSFSSFSLSLSLSLSLARSLARSLLFFLVSLIIVADCAVNATIVKYSITVHWHS